MAGIALLLDLAKRNPSLSSSAKSIHAHTLISAAAAASAAALSYTAGLPLSSRFLFGLVFRLNFLLCDETLTESSRFGGD